MRYISFNARRSLSPLSFLAIHAKDEAVLSVTPMQAEDACGDVPMQGKDPSVGVKMQGEEASAGADDDASKPCGTSLYSFESKLLTKFM